MSCDRSCFDKEHSDFWYDDCPTCNGRDDGPNASTRHPNPPQIKPLKFLADGTRYKVARLDMGCCIFGLPDDLAGEWVALVQATNDMHLKYVAPSTEPISANEIPSLLSAQVWRELPSEIKVHLVRAIEAKIRGEK